MMTKFDTFLFGIIATTICCGWLVYNNLDSRIKTLEKQQQNLIISVIDIFSKDK